MKSTCFPHGHIVVHCQANWSGYERGAAARRGGSAFASWFSRVRVPGSGLCAAGRPAATSCPALCPARVVTQQGAAAGPCASASPVSPVPTGRAALPGAGPLRQRSVRYQVTSAYQV